MTFVAVGIGHGKSLGLHGFDNLVWLILLDARIVVLMPDEQWPQNALHKIEGRVFL